MSERPDIFERFLSRLGQWAETGGDVAFAVLFWTVAILMAVSTMAVSSLDLFIKAFTGVAAAGVALAVWRSTRAFQRASVETANKKLRLDLFKERLPIWQAFKLIRSEIVDNQAITDSTLHKLIDISRDAEVLFPAGPIHEVFGRYVELATRINLGQERRYGSTITNSEFARTAAIQEIIPLGIKLGNLIVAAIRIDDL